MSRSRWTTSPEATLDLGPATTEAKLLKLRVYCWTPSHVVEAVRLTINGYMLDVSLDIIGDDTAVLRAPVPSAALMRGGFDNWLKIASDLFEPEAGTQLGLPVVGVELTDV